jgi:hypothetical protein
MAELELRTTTSPTTSSDRAFVNRESEVRSLGRLLLGNIARGRLASESRSQQRMTLVTSAQMFGAGKTALGVYFLARWGKLLQDGLGGDDNELPEQDCAHLLGLTHVLVDLRFAETFQRAMELLAASLVAVEHARGSYRLGQHDQLRADLASATTMTAVVRAFETEFHRYYLVHFDDLGKFASESVHTLCAFLSDISAMQDTRPTPKSLVFVTSRSPLLYMLGSHLVRSGLPDWTSPSSANCIVVDSLKPRHIEELILLQPECKEADPKTARQVSETIFARTGGIPRFVVGAVDLLKIHASGAPSLLSPYFSLSRSCSLSARSLARSSTPSVHDRLFVCTLVSPPIVR